MQASHVPGGVVGLDADHPELAADLERIARASVLVLGDATLERRVQGDFLASGQDGERRAGGAFLLGPEEAEPGGGASVVRALASLGVATAFICVLGDDLAGAELTALIGAQANVEPWLLVDGVKATTTETRYVDARGETVLHTIREDVRPMAPKLRERMLRIAGDAMAATSVTVLSDRGHGTLDVETATAILTRTRQAGRRIVADVASVSGIDLRFRGFDVVIRLAETGHERASPAEAARALRAHEEVGCAVLVQPDGGAVLADREGEIACPFPRRATAAETHAAFVAGFAGAMATGRALRRALLVAAASIQRAATP